ncbi:MAG: sigma-70 family RNA polymerase sigma factor [Planctomycetota bacterium]
MSEHEPPPKSLDLASDPASGWHDTWSQHAGWLRTVIASRMDRVWVDEVLQNVAIKAWEKQDQLSCQEKLAPWLYRIAIQQVTLFFRESSRRKKVGSVSVTAAETTADPRNIDPLEILTRNEIHQQIREGIAQLNVEEREILLLKHTEGWTYQQLADHLGLSLDKVIYRLGKARDNLRNKLQNLTGGKP